MHPRLTPPDADGGRDDHTHRETTSAQPRSDRSSLSPRPSSSRLPCCVCNRLFVAALVHDSKLPDSDPNPRRLTDQYCATLAAQAWSESYPVSRSANQLTQATAPADSSALRTRPEVSRRSYNSSAPLHQLDVHAAPDHCGGPLQAAERDVVVRIEQPVHLRAARLQQRRHLRRPVGHDRPGPHGSADRAAVDGVGRGPLNGRSAGDYPAISVTLRAPAPPDVRPTAGPRRAIPPRPNPPPRSQKPCTLRRIRPASTPPLNTPLY